jgi:hypothetical protein
MGHRPGSLLGCTQVRTKVHRKDYAWSVGLVYDPRRLLGVTIVRPGVAGVLQIFVTPGLNNKLGAPTCTPQYIHEVMSSMVINILELISEYSALLHSLTSE